MKTVGFHILFFDLQSIVKEGGKQNVEEIKVTDNAEESKAKDYATALQRMQNALKREKQVQLLKQMNEKNKTNVRHLIRSKIPIKFITIFISLNRTINAV